MTTWVQARFDLLPNAPHFLDPMQGDNKERPVHRWVPWVAGFGRDFVADAIARYLPRPGTVLDPFAGVGTTLIEAMLAGHHTLGFEINPYAALACTVKSQAARMDLSELAASIKIFERFYRDGLETGHAPKSVPPIGFKTRAPFYSPAVLHKVLWVWDYIHSLADGPIKETFRLAFASTMVSYSNYSYEPSLGQRVSAGKAAIQDDDVGGKIAGKLRTMLAGSEWFQHTLINSNVTAQVIRGSFFGYQPHLAPASVDLIVTSPPYLNNYHYIRNTRPQMYWLGFAHRPSDLQPLESLNFGTYWQTAREAQKIDLTFDLPDSDLQERLAHLRTLRSEKGLYGGHGWANYAAAYFNDCLRLASGIQEVLRPGGIALVVIGNSILQGVPIPTDQYMGQIAVKAGLEVVRIDIPRATRVGNSIIQSEVRAEAAQGRDKLYEAVIELRKP